ncbi:hypothetical protein MHYP_G00216560 [Metynnis hypsauchen]
MMRFRMVMSCLFNFRDSRCERIGVWKTPIASCGIGQVFLLVHYFTHSATLKTGLHLQNWMASPSPRIGQTGR